MSANYQPSHSYRRNYTQDEREGYHGAPVASTGVTAFQPRDAGCSFPSGNYQERNRFDAVEQLADVRQLDSPSQRPCDEIAVLDQMPVHAAHLSSMTGQQRDYQMPKRPPALQPGPQYQEASGLFYLPRQSANQRGALPSYQSYTSAFQPFQRRVTRAPMGANGYPPLQDLSNSSLFTNQDHNQSLSRLISQTGCVARGATGLNPYAGRAAFRGLRQPAFAGTQHASAFRAYRSSGQEDQLDNSVAQMSKRLNGINLANENEKILPISKPTSSGWENQELNFGHDRRSYNTLESEPPKLLDEEFSSMYQQQQAKINHGRKLEQSPHGENMPYFLLQEPTAISNTRQDELSELGRGMIKFSSRPAHDILDLQSSINEDSRYLLESSSFQYQTHQMGQEQQHLFARGLITERQLQRSQHMHQQTLPKQPFISRLDEQAFAQEGLCSRNGQRPAELPRLGSEEKKKGIKKQEGLETVAGGKLPQNCGQPRFDLFQTQPKKAGEPQVSVQDQTGRESSSQNQQVECSQTRNLKPGAQKAASAQEGAAGSPGCQQRVRRILRIFGVSNNSKAPQPSTNSRQSEEIEHRAPNQAPGSRFDRHEDCKGQQLEEQRQYQSELSNSSARLGQAPEEEKAISKDSIQEEKHRRIPLSDAENPTLSPHCSASIFGSGQRQAGIPSPSQQASQSPHSKRGSERPQEGQTLKNRGNRDTDAKQHRQGQKDVQAQMQKFEEQRERLKQRENQRRTYGEFSEIYQKQPGQIEQMDFEIVGNARLRNGEINDWAQPFEHSSQKNLGANRLQHQPSGYKDSGVNSVGLFGIRPKELGDSTTRIQLQEIDSNRGKLSNEPPSFDSACASSNLTAKNAFQTSNGDKSSRYEPSQQPCPSSNARQGYGQLSHSNSLPNSNQPEPSETVPASLQHQNSLSLSLQSSILERSKQQTIRPYRHLNFVKNDRSRQMKMPIFREQDIFFDTIQRAGESKRSIGSSQRFNQQVHLFKDNLCEQQQDDDVDTDEEVLGSGLEQCYTDLRELKHQLRARPTHFRSDTNVVQIWKKKGFWFNDTASLNNCANNFGCSTIF